MTITVSAPDGSTVDFPDGTDAGVIHSAMTQHFGSATPPPADQSLTGTLQDIGTQIPTKFAKGVIDLAGLPADAREVHANLFSKGLGALGFDVDPKTISTVMRILPLMGGPTTDQMTNTVESMTGPLPEAKTKPGEYFGRMAEFAPGALAGGESVIPNLIKNAVLPAIGSQYLSDKVKGSWLEPIANVVGALAGRGAAGAGSKGIEMLANRSAAGSAASALGPDITPGAVARVGKSFSEDSLTPADVAAKAADLGPEAMMLDMGRQMGGRAEAIASQPGRGQNTVLNAVENRTGQFGSGTASRIKDTLDQTMGPSPNIVQEKNAIAAIVDQHAKPLYDSVMSAHPIVDVPSSITNRPAVAQSMKDGISLAKNYGEDVTGQPSLAYWDYVKKAMDARINGMLKTGGVQDLNSQDKADLGGLMNARQALVNHLDDVTGGAYAVARRVAATKFQINDAIDLGSSALNTKLLPEELADQMTGMSIPEQSGVRLGMRREVDRIIDTARNDGAAARRILDTNQNSEKIATIFGTPAADAIANRIAAETQFQNATNKIGANSRTAVRGQLMKDTEEPSISGPPAASALGLVGRGLQYGRQFMANQGMDRTRSAIGNLVTRQGSDMSKLADVLANYNAKVAANAPGMPLGNRSQRLAAVLAAQQTPQLKNQSQR